MQEAESPAAQFNRRNKNCGDIAPDDADVDGRNGADDGVDPGAECDVGSSSGLLFKLNA